MVTCVFLNLEEFPSLSLHWHFFKNTGQVVRGMFLSLDWSPGSTWLDEGFCMRGKNSTKVMSVGPINTEVCPDHWVKLMFARFVHFKFTIFLFVIEWRIRYNLWGDTLRWCKYFAHYPLWFSNSIISSTLIGWHSTSSLPASIKAFIVTAAWTKMDD